MKVISIDQSTQSTKAFLFDENGRILDRASLSHRQIYPQTGFVEHDPEEIYVNTVKVITELVRNDADDDAEYSIALTNQRETVVVWYKNTGKPVCNAVVWQCMRGEQICNSLKESGHMETFRKKSGLLIDPYFSGSGVKWILDNVEGAREAAEKGELLLPAGKIWDLTNLRPQNNRRINLNLPPGGALYFGCGLSQKQLDEVFSSRFRAERARYLLLAEKAQGAKIAAVDPDSFKKNPPQKALALLLDEYGKLQSPSSGTH